MALNLWPVGLPPPRFRGLDSSERDISLTVNQSSERMMLSASVLLLASPCVALAPHSFAERVERRLVEKFGGEADRVVESWRACLMYSRLRRFSIGAASEGRKISRPLGEHPLMRQEAHSVVEGLRCEPFWKAYDFDWAQ